MKSSTTRFSSIAAAAVVGASVAGLMMAPSASAAPANPPAPGATASAPVEAPAHPEMFNSGTEVTVRNDGDETMWVRRWHQKTDYYWESPVELSPGAEFAFAGKHGLADDVELRVFFDKSKADANTGGIEIDAENPAYSAPWMSVDWDSEYFSVGGTHTWIAHDGSRYWGKRLSDDGYKKFRLHVTNV